jgi:Uma2 family endonuclease
MAATLGLMTFAEFEQMPDNGRRYELRRGEPIEAPPAIHTHFAIQQQLRRLMETAAEGSGQVATEWGFRVGGDEFRVADVAFLRRERWDRIDRYLEGAPDLVVEVLSPSNGASEMLEKQILCLENGCQEFWVVDPRRLAVSVSTATGPSRTYRTGQQIPLMFGGQIEVSAIFG